VRRRAQVRSPGVEYHEGVTTAANDALKETAPMEQPPMNRSEKFAVGLFSLITALIVLPGLVLTVVAVLNTGTIYLPYRFSF
jgi:hypothetical protein